MDSSGNCSVCFLSPALAEETRGFPCINVMFNSDGRFAMRFSMSGKPSVGKHRNIAHGSVLYRELLSRGYRFEGRHSLKVVQTVRQGGYIYEIFEQGNEIRPGEKIIGK
jgi:hypothetical protein